MITDIKLVPTLSLDTLFKFWCNINHENDSDCWIWMGQCAGNKKST